MQSYNEGDIADGPNGALVFRGGQWVPVQASPHPMTIGTPNPVTGQLKNAQLDGENLRNQELRIKLQQMQPIAANPALDKLTGPDFLGKLPATDAAKVKALAEGRLAFPGGAALRSPYWQQMLDNVTHYDPSFDAVNFNARSKTRNDFTSGKSAQNVRALNTAIGHLGQLADQIDGTAGHSGFPGATAVNAIQNALSRSSGSPGPALYDQTAGAVSSELTQVFRGSGGAEADVKRYLGELSGNASREQKLAAVQNISGLLKSRLDSLGDTYRQGMGTTAQGLSLLNPHAEGVLNAVSQGKTPRELGVVPDPTKWSNAPIAPVGGNPGGPPPASGGMGGPGGPSGGNPSDPYGVFNQPSANRVTVGGGTQAVDTPTTRAIAAKMGGMLSGGVPDKDVLAYAATIPGMDLSGVRANLAARAKGWKGGYSFDFGTEPVSAAQKAYNDAGTSAAGTAALHAGLAAGSLGNGAVRLGTTVIGANGGNGYDLRDLFGNKDINSAVMSSMDAAHPYAAVAGDLAGSALPLFGMERLAQGGIDAGINALAPRLTPGALKLAQRAAPAVSTGLSNATFGALQGASAAPDGQVGSGALVGGLAGLAGGAAGQAVGRYVAGPALQPLINGPINRVGNAVRGMMGRAPSLVPDALSKGDQMVVNAAQKGGVDAIQDRLALAQSLGVPMALADAHPALTSLAGSAVRFSPKAEELAQNTLLPRSRGQIDRFGNAVQSNLGPIGNTLELSNGLQQQARTAAAPLYGAAYSAEPMGSDTIDGLLNRPFGKSALDKAQMIAANDGKSPTALGFRHDAQGNVILDPAPTGPDISNVPPMPADGLYANVKAPNEADTLGRRNIPSPINGAVTMPKRGPLDLVSFLRTKGGLKPQGGELDHYGITNAPRTGMDFAGGEGRFGKLVDPANGMNYDDAAQLAHEAGYFPGHYDRPSVDEFLDTLNQTHSGNNRAFTPEDMPEVDNFNAARDARWNVEGAKEAGAPLTNYLGQPVGMNDLQTPPMSAYKPSMEPLPPGSPSPVYTPETLDYVKRGMDSVLEKYRDPTTGRLDLSSNPQALSEQGVRKQFVSAVDALNPSYRDARQAFAGPMQSRDALHLGQDLFSSSYGANDVGAAVAGKSPEQISQMQLGYRDSLMNAANLLRRSSNPFGAIDSPTAEAKLGGMYFDNPNVPQFLQTRDMENGLARSTNDIMGNSKTAQRTAADQSFSDGGLPQMVLDAGLNLATGQVPIGLLAKKGVMQGVKDFGTWGAGQARIAKADAVAPWLFNTDPTASSSALSNLINSSQARNDFILGQRRKAGMLGGIIGSGYAASSLGSN